MSDEESPVCRGFEYRVRLAVSIPLAWAEFLREVARHHYDHWCRESAKAGVVNALCNTACDAEYPSNYPVEWRDLDLLAKIMEQAQHHAKSEETRTRVVRINAWIRQAKDWIVERSEALAKWDTEQARLVSETT